MHIRFGESPKKCPLCGVSLRSTALSRSGRSSGSRRCHACGLTLDKPPNRLLPNDLKRARRWCNQNWGAARGLAHTSYNNALVLVAATVEEVASALASRAAQWERDVLGHEITMAEPSLLIFRLRGQAWTEVLASNDEYEERRRLSRRMGVRVIYYCVAHTTGFISYEFYDKGRRLEMYCGTNGEVDRFASEMRPGIPSERDYPGGWPDAFFQEQEAFEPGIDFDYFFGRRRPAVGASALVQNPGFAESIAPLVDAISWPGLERVDFIALKESRPHRAR